MRLIYCLPIVAQFRPFALLLVASCLLLGKLANAQESASGSVLVSLDETSHIVPWNPAGNFVAVDRQVFKDSQAIHEALQKVCEMNWKEISFSNAMNELAAAMAITIALDTEGLEEAGILRNQPVSIRTRGRGKLLLSLILEPLKLDYVVKDGVLVITSAEKAGETLETRVYGVADLVRSPQFARVEKVALRIPVPEGSRVVYGASLQQDDREYADFDTLIDIITSMVEPDSWVDNGGSGSISGFRSSLVVSQTARVHEDVAHLLQQLRAAEGLVRVHEAAEKSAGAPLSD